MNIQFKPNSEEERQFFEDYSNQSKAASKMIRSIPQEKRLATLKEVNPTDTTLLALFLLAIKQEDYEICTVAKTLIEERGIPITKWPSP